MTAVKRPDWWRPDMSAADIAVWEAAERCANAAPEIRPGDEVALDLQRLYRNFPAFLRERRAEQRPDQPAA